MGMGNWLATAMFSAHSDHVVAATSQDAQPYRAAGARPTKKLLNGCEVVLVVDGPLYKIPPPIIPRIFIGGVELEWGETKQHLLDPGPFDSEVRDVKYYKEGTFPTMPLSPPKHPAKVALFPSALIALVSTFIVFCFCKVAEAAHPIYGSAGAGGIAFMIAFISCYAAEKSK